MTLDEIDAGDPRWSRVEGVVIAQLQKQVNDYVTGGRYREAHGVRKSLLIYANVLIECEAQVTNFQSLP